MTSPYIISGPALGPQFYNRKSLLDEITGGRHRAMYVIGGRQMGKTSLLRKIAELKPALHLDVQLAAGDLRLLAKQLLREISRQKRQLTWLPDTFDTAKGDFFDFLEVAADAAAQNDQLIYLLIDESDGLLENSEAALHFLNRLRGLSQNCGGLRLVLTASRRLSKANALFQETQMSPFLDGFTPFFLSPFSHAESKKLLQRSNAGAPLEIPPTLEAEIIRLSGGHPHFLQLLGYYLYQNNVWNEITEELLGRIDHIAAGLFENDFATLTNTERQILKQVSQADDLSFARLQAAIAEPRLSILLEGLVAHGYLRRLETYATGSVFLDRWLDTLSPKDWAAPSPVPDESAFELSGSKKQIEDIRSLLTIHRNNLSHYRKIEAQYGFDYPLYVSNGIRHEEEQITQLESQLKRLLNR